MTTSPINLFVYYKNEMIVLTSNDVTRVSGFTAGDFISFNVTFTNTQVQHPTSAIFEFLPGHSLT